jgi:hypothetical protein
VTLILTSTSLFLRFSRRVLKTNKTSTLDSFQYRFFSMLLVFYPINSFTQTSELFEDGIGGGVHTKGRL